MDSQIVDSALVAVAVVMAVVVMLEGSARGRCRRLGRRRRRRRRGCDTYNVVEFDSKLKAQVLEFCVGCEKPGMFSHKSLELPPWRS